MFYGSCRKISKILSFSLEPISKSDVHYLARIVSSRIIVASKPRYRRFIAVDETRLRIKKVLTFLKKALKLCSNKPMVIVDRGPWYRWALDRLGVEYRYQRFGVRNVVERFFGYLKQRTRRFYNNINTWRINSIEDYASTIAIIRNLTIIIKNRGRVLPS